MSSALQPRQSPRCSCPHPRRSPQTGFGMLARILFRPSPELQRTDRVAPRPLTSWPFHYRISVGLITDSPMSIYCSHGNLLRFSLLRVSSLSRIIATTTKICTRVTVACRLTPYTSSRAPRTPTHTKSLIFGPTCNMAYHR